MIRRDANPHWLLTAQNDHAALAGQIAAHYGNADFDPPAPLEPVLQAVTLHDAGWPLHDDEPTLNPAGQPLHVFETPLEVALNIWTASVDRAATIGGDYTGLLVSFHQLHLSAAVHLAGGSPAGAPPDPRRRFALNKFQQRQIERQAEFRARLGLRTDQRLALGIAPSGTSPAEDLLHRNFRLLTLADRLSLQLCCGKMLFPEIGDILPAAGSEPIVLTTRYVDDNDLAIDPWPFDVKTLTLTAPARRLPAVPLRDDTALRRAYRAATAEPVAYTLRSM